MSTEAAFFVVSVTTVSAWAVYLLSHNVPRETPKVLITRKISLVYAAINTAAILIVAYAKLLLG